MATVKLLLLPYCKILCHNRTHYLAHCSYNSARLSPDSITMEEKLYDPSTTSMHLVLNDIFDAIFVDEKHTLLEKRRKPIQPRVAAVLN